MTTKLSVVSAYYQLEEMTNDFLNNLSMHLPEDTELILVNAGSKKIEHPLITKRIDLPVNKSFSNSMNAGIKEATGDYVCVMGNDVFPSNDFLTRLLKTAQEYNSWITSPINDKTDLKNYELIRIDKGIYRANFFPAVCWLISRECIEKVGLFDEVFEVGCYEDNDYLERVKAEGNKIVVNTNISVGHLESQTINLFENIKDISNENSKKFHAKHYNY